VRVLIPLPDRDFDVTEVAVPWQLLRRAGHEITFATERGDGPAPADPPLLSGVLFGKLGAASEPIAFHREMVSSVEYRAPIAWAHIEPAAFDGLILPGGHAPGMRQYLGSALLQEKAAAFWGLGRPVGAICHGVMLLARSRDLRTGRSVIATRRTTCLLKYQERTAYLLTAWRLGRYYRTYPAYVEDEVRAALDDASQFETGPHVYTKRGTLDDDSPAFVVEDGNYVSARWPGDAYLFAKRFGALLTAGVNAGAVDFGLARSSQGQGVHHH
jgi:putative intracellular protease/amidase